MSDEHDDIDADVARLEAENAAARESMVARAHRKHGVAGAIVAGGMLAIDQVLGRKPKEQPAAVSEFSGEPTDIDANGIVHVTAKDLGTGKSQSMTIFHYNP